MADRCLPVVDFSYWLARNGAHDDGFDGVLLESLLQGNGIDNRCEHAHMICRNFANAEGFAVNAAKDIAAANNDSCFNAGVDEIFDPTCDLPARVACHAVLVFAHEGLS